MDYKRIYDSIINYRINNKYDGYTEKHHIVPKSLGGVDDTTNIVRLTAREHYICHLLLTKIYKVGTPEWVKMIKAFMMMVCCKSNNQDRHITSREFAQLREVFAKLQSINQIGDGNSQHGTKWIHNISLQRSIKINQSDNVPIGWSEGRVINFERVLKKKKNKDEKFKLLDLIHQQKVVEYSKLHSIYVEVGFTKFVELTAYDKTQQNLVMAFKRYVPEFIPQNGKKRYKS